MLAFDTTGAVGSAALLGAAAARRPFRRGDLEDFVEILEPANRHAANLLPAIEHLLAGAGVRKGVSGLSRLAATRGPGSFTGLRVGLSTLHGLALASGVPAFGVSALDAAALTDDLAAPGGGPRSAGPRLIVLDALRGELFAAVYPGPESPPPGGRGRPPRALSEPFRLVPRDCAPWVRRFGVGRVAGPGVRRYRGEIARALAGGGVEIAAESLPLAPAAARLAATLGPGEARGAGPLYLRPPDIHGRPGEPPPAAAPGPPERRRGPAAPGAGG